MVADSAPLAVAVADLSGRIVHVNDEFVTLWRLSDRREAIGRPVEEFWQDRDRANAVVDAMRTEGAWHGGLTARLGDGTALELEVSATLVMGEDSRPICMLSSFVDLTDRKRMTEVAREGEERFRRVFEQGTFAMAMSSRDFRFYKVNAAFCSMFGYTEEEFATLTFREITHRDHLGADTDGVARLTRGEIPVYQTEKRYITKSGAVIWGKLTLSVLRDSEGGFLHYLAMIENIDERRRAEAAMQRAERLESLSVLAGGIAHDFNNLLLGILGHIDLARRTLSHDSRAMPYLEEALAVSGRATALTEQLLTFAKGGAPRKETVSLREIIDRVTRFALSGSNVACNLSLPEDLWACEADEDQLTRAIENVVINARQAMPSGGTLAISARNVPTSDRLPPPLQSGQYVKVDVVDHGSGIPEHIRAHIFDPFFTTKPRGSGLGLATAFSILKRHGGHIDVASTLGEGSTFTLYIPSTARTSESATHRTATVASRPHAVLVMDDDPIVRQVAAEMLRSAGHLVSLAEDGEQAVEIYRSAEAEGRPFDVVILDLTVPGGMGGAQAIGELLALDPSARVVASSGYSADPIMSDPEKYGFIDSLAKPYECDGLLRVVESASRGAVGRE